MTELEQAQYLVRGYLLTLYTGYVDKVFWFCDLDTGDSIHARTADSGICVLYLGDIPKLAYAALANLCHQMGVPHLVQRLVLPDPVIAFLRDDGNKTVLTSWCEQGHSHLVLPAGRSKIKAFDMMGNPIPLRTQKGNLTFRLSGSPIYVKGASLTAWRGASENRHW